MSALAGLLIVLPLTAASVTEASPLAFAEAASTSALVPVNVTHRNLASAGCNNCCYQNDCSLAFSQSQPGICCGAHRVRGQVGCCPSGASCVACGNIWKCSRSYSISRTTRCRICSDDMPPECRMAYGHRYGYHHGGSFLSSLVLLLGLVAICMCMYRRDPYEDDVIIVQGGQPVYGPNGQIIQQGGQTVVVQGGGYGPGYGPGYGYGGGAAVAGAAATGFVGGVMMAEAMDVGHHGYYGGGGGYAEGGDMGGGDAGFGADQ